MTVTDPAYAPMPELACMAPGCPEAATAHLIVIDAPNEHQLPVCAGHHREYSQPGHLKHLKELAGLVEEKLHVHQPGDQGQGDQPVEPQSAVGEQDDSGPGPEVVSKPAAKRGAKPAESAESDS
jgi:hypothetical protein